MLGFDKASAFFWKAELSVCVWFFFFLIILCRGVMEDDSAKW